MKNTSFVEFLENKNSISKEEKYQMIGLTSLLDEKGKIKIPQNIKQIKIDIGLSFSAPNSSLWLLDTDDRMVFGFEPSPICINALNVGVGGRSINPDQAGISISEDAIYRNDSVLKKGIKENFKLLCCGLDNVPENNPYFVPFYMTPGDPGCSSLSIPTEKLPEHIRNSGSGLQMTAVLVMSFYDFLDKIPWDRFDFIEQVKIDTQGRDLDILKSSKEYINNIVFLQVENSTNGEYQQTHTQQEIHDFLEESGFAHISTIGVDSSYINKKYIHLKDELHNVVV